MSGRTIAIGDIHGCSIALTGLLKAFGPRDEDTVVVLGDYVDRGPDVRTSIHRLLELSKWCNLVMLLGNHEEMMLDIIDGEIGLLPDWLSFGGQETLASYDCSKPQHIPKEHIDFVRGSQMIYETETHFFVHASYVAGMPLSMQPRWAALWETLRSYKPGAHQSGKTAIVGHTAQKDGEILDLGYLKCIDTWCYGEGWLTAMDVNTGQVWQVDKFGKFRLGGLSV